MTACPSISLVIMQQHFHLLSFSIHKRKSGFRRPSIVRAVEWENRCKGERSIQARIFLEYRADWLKLDLKQRSWNFEENVSPSIREKNRPILSEDLFSIYTLNSYGKLAALLGTLLVSLNMSLYPESVSTVLPIVSQSFRTCYWSSTF